MESLKNQAAHFISHAFHPLFMPTFGTLFFYFSNSFPQFNSLEKYQNSNYYILSITILFSLIIPIAGVAILKKRGKVQSFQMQHREERFLPFAITAGSLFCAYYLIFELAQLNNNLLLRLFYFGCLLSVIGALGISLKWKISVHMIGIGGFTGAIYSLSKLSEQVYTDELITAMLLSGLIAFSRLQLNAHSFKQVVAGFALGFCSETFYLVFWP